MKSIQYFLQLIMVKKLDISNYSNVAILVDTITKKVLIKDIMNI